jgi:hypothetical protein
MSVHLWIGKTAQDPSSGFPALDHPFTRKGGTCC